MNRYSSNADKTAVNRANGGGLAMRWKCMGCNQVRDILGSRGVGARKVCAVCVAKRLAA